MFIKYKTVECSCSMPRSVSIWMTDSLRVQN